MVRRHLNDVRETAAACERDPQLASIGKELARAVAPAESATAWLQERMRSNKASDALAGATPYLKMMGLLTAAQLLAKGARAPSAPRAGRPDKQFLANTHRRRPILCGAIAAASRSTLGPITRGGAGPFALEADAIGR